MPSARRTVEVPEKGPSLASLPYFPSLTSPYTLPIVQGKEGSPLRMNNKLVHIKP